MNDFSIQKRSFDIQKNKLKALLLTAPSSISLPTTKTRSWGVFSHKVTGSELNELTDKIQTNLISTNAHVIEIIQNFKEIYNTFETLDKEYIAKIVASVKAAEIASKQANENSNDIRKLIEVQKVTINKLVEFKDQFESVHEVGQKWDYIKNLKEQIDSIQEIFYLNKEQIEEQVKLLQQNSEDQKKDIIEKLDKSSSNIYTKINDLKQYQEEKHKNIKSTVKIIEESFNEKFTIQENIITKQKENIIEKLDKSSSNIYTKINDLKQYQNEQFKSLNQEVEDINNGVSEIKNEINFQKEQFTKKIKYVYIATSVIGAISLTHIVLNLLKIL